MDKIDQSIKEARQMHEPNAEFISSTMQKVEAIGVPKRQWYSWKVLAPVAGVAGVVLVGIVMFTPHFGGATANTTTSGNTHAGTDIQSQTAVNAPIDPANTTDAALDGDLSSVQASLAQSSSDQSAADASVNDSQQQISIPTE